MIRTDAIRHLFHILQKLRSKTPSPILALARNVLLRHYSTHKVYLSWSLKSQVDLTKKSILIYSPPKTGSTTICRSLESLSSNMPIYHIHFLTKKYLDELETMFRESHPRIRRIPGALLQSQYLSERLNKGLNITSWKIIAGVRDPIAQHISYFLYMMHVLRPPAVEYKRKIEYSAPEDLAKELVELFLQNIDVADFATKIDSQPWFDLEFKHILGIDVFSERFPKSKGYKIYKDNHAEALVYKLEALDKCAKQAFAEFLGIEDLALIKENIAEDKKYAAVYRKFLELIALPRSYIEKTYSSKYVRHFYSNEEIKGFKARWRK